jgi:esterase/lipase
MEEKISIQNSRGKNLSAIVSYPKEPAKKLAIVCPGFLDSRDYDHLLSLAGMLAARGYTVARFNPTGTWDSEGDISQYTLTQYLSDTDSVLSYMLQKGNYSEVLLGGHSRGGMMCLLFAAQDNRVSKVVAIMPSSNRTVQGKTYEEWKANGFHISKRDIPGTSGMREYTVPYSHVEDKAKYDVVADVKKIHIPTLYITADKDTIVLPEYVKEIYNNANEPKKLILLEGIGHDYRENSHEIERVNAEISGWLDKESFTK